MLSEAKIVLMDEPTAAISVRQVAEVLNLIRQLRDRGIAVVLISHRMPDVFAVADRIVVLRRGRKVADKPIAASSPEEVTGLITGAIEQAAVTDPGRAGDDMSTMAITLDETIERARPQLAHLAAVAARPSGSSSPSSSPASSCRFATNAFADPEQPLQRHPQLHLRRRSSRSA